MDKDITRAIEPSECYYWFDDHIEIATRYAEELLELPNEGFRRYTNIIGYDPFCGNRHYGKFTYYGVNTINRHLLYWEEVFPHEIPKEFLTNLLLLGIDPYAHTSETNNA